MARFLRSSRVVQRNPNPKTIREFEKDEQVFGPAHMPEAVRIETKLAWEHLASAARHIEDTRALLRRVRANAEAAALVNDGLAGQRVQGHTV
jgi:hypothetical protein